MTNFSSKPLSELLDRDVTIDVLRGVAAMSVLIFHARGIFWLGFVQTYHIYGLHPNFNAFLGYLSEPFSYGFLGVNLFFVLSGYCIHRRGAQLLAQNSEAIIDLKAFYIRRFWRIYPTYVAALVITAIVGYWVPGSHSFSRPDQDNSVYSFLISLLTLQGYFAPYFGDNGVFWTLAIEVHLYLAYPILFLISRRFGAQKAVLFTLLLACIYLAIDQFIGIETHLPFRAVQGPIFIPYWFTWAVGFYIAEVETGREKDLSENAWKILMIFGVLLGLPPVLHGAHPKFDDLFWAFFFAGFLRWSLKPSSKRFWSGKFGVMLSSIGVFSYSLYAIHAPLLDLIHFVITPTDSYKFTTIWPTFAAVLFSIPCAWLFFQLVERWSIIGKPTSKKANKNSLFIESATRELDISPKCL